MASDLPSAPARPLGTHLPIGLLGLTVAIFLIGQISGASQSSKNIGFQMSNGQKQMENGAKAKTELEAYIKVLDDEVAKANKQQQDITGILEDLVKLSATDEDALALVNKHGIKMQEPPKPADKPADKPAPTP